MESKAQSIPEGVTGPNPEPQQSSLARTKLWLIFAAMRRGTSSADRFRAFAVRTGLKESGPTLVQALERSREPEAGGSRAKQAAAAVAPISEACRKKIREAPPCGVAIPAEVDSNSAVSRELLSWRITV